MFQLFKNSFILLCVLKYAYTDDFKYCKTSDDSDSCLVDAMQNALNSLDKDRPEYGLENLKVLSIPSLTIEAGKGAIHFAQNYRNLKFFGITDGKIKDAHYDKANKILTFTNLVPLVQMKSEYSVNGKMLELPITGDGPCEIDLYNLSMIITIALDEYDNSGTTYLKIKSLTFEAPITKLTGHFYNLFNGNDLLGDNINKLLNDEWDLLYSDQKPEMEKAFASYFQTYIQKFFDKIPANELF